MVVKAGDWDIARRLLTGAPLKMRAALGKSLRQEAQALRKEIVQGITSQAPGGEAFAPLSPLTLVARQLRGFKGTKALIVRADLMRSIVVIIEGDQAFIGIARTARGRDGQPLVDVAKAHEFGAGPFVVPMTPKQRRFLFLLLKRAGKTPQGGGRGVIVVNIPARPYLRPAFNKFRQGAQRRFLERFAEELGFGGL